MTVISPLFQIINYPSTGAAGDLRGMGAEAVRRVVQDAKSEHTRRAYESDLSHFFSCQGETVDAAAVELLLGQDAARLMVTLRSYVNACRRTGLAETTISRRLAAVRSLLRTARMLGAPTPDPKLLLGAVKVEKYSDVVGPSLPEVGMLLDAIDRETIKGKRDYAILLLLVTNGLRREEIIATDIRDFDRSRHRLRILGKGRARQEWVTLLPETVEAITAYLDQRANTSQESPLFVNCDRREKGEGGRLTGRGLWKVVDDYGQKVLGVRLHPHALRHTAITEGADATGGNLPMLQEFSRHRDINTVMIYVAKSRDGQGEITRRIGERLKEARKPDS